MENIALYAVLIGLVLATGAVAVLPGRLVSLGALAAQQLLVALLIGVVADPNILLFGQAINAAVPVQVVAAATATGILFVTVIDLRKHESADAQSQMQASAVVQDGQLAGHHHAQIQDYFIPVASLLVVAMATYALARVYPITGERQVDRSFYWLGLSALVTLAASGDLFKAGLSLLICLSGVNALQAIAIGEPRVLTAATGGIAIVLVALALGWLCIAMQVSMGTLSLSKLRVK